MSPPIHPAHQWLEAVYQLHDRLMTDSRVACRKFCAVCCTSNVTVTSLEAAFIAAHLARNPRPGLLRLEALAAATGHKRFQPRLTTNHMADLCRDQKDLPEALMPADTPACPLLVDQACSIYAVRPFSCRNMVSTTPCHNLGHADMPPLIISINTIFMQFIEDIDQDGTSGNLIDMLVLALKERTDIARDPLKNARPLPPPATNRAARHFLLPSEHHSQVFHVAQALNRIRLP